jgi:hypothetical protein
MITSIGHILIIKDNEMHYFSYLFGKVKVKQSRYKPGDKNDIIFWVPNNIFRILL